MTKEDIKKKLISIIKEEIGTKDIEEKCNKFNDAKLMEDLDIDEFDYCQISIAIDITFSINTSNYMINSSDTEWVDRSINELVEFIYKQIN